MGAVKSNKKSYTLVSKFVGEKNEEKSRKVTKKGSVQWTDDVFKVAKENNAYSYVTLPNSDKIYTIEEYQNMFFMSKINQISFQTIFSYKIANHQANIRFHF